MQDFIGKNNNFEAEKQTLYTCLQNKIATIRMVADETGIQRPNLTRHKRDLEKNNLLFEVRIGICKSSGYHAMYVTTSPFLRDFYKKARVI